MVELAQKLPAAALTSARRVLAAEADALHLFAERIPADFENVVSLILQCSGRVIVSGIGKSGHIGRKISATLTSTGTPSFFIHAAEASHGDLGIIGQDDVCILLSNSGETAELRDILAYTRRFSIPLVAISGRADSLLMTAADFRLQLPDAPEVCPNGMAPTTSTTMMMALGDALAVALMEERGFAADNFREFHPGGNLGAQMKHAGELMHAGQELPIVRTQTLMSETLIAMTSKGFGIAIVVDETERLYGLVTDGDLRRNMADLMSRTAGEIATRNPITIPPDMLAAQALALMNERKISVLLLVDDNNKPQGILHIHDLLRTGVA